MAVRPGNVYCVARIAAGIGRVAVDCKLGRTSCNDHLLCVDPWINEDGLSGSGGCAESIDRSLDLEEKNVKTMAHMRSV